MSARLTTAIAAVILAAPLAAAQSSNPILVSAAASLADVLNDLARRHERATGQVIRVNVAASNVLARQIVEGAKADLFVSADDAQMDVVERAGRLVPGSRVALLTNQLVVVGAPDGALSVTGARSLAAPALKRLALGNPDSVPAGVYARQWLEKAGVWPDLAGRVVPTLSVRAALAAVRAARADAAVVYLTDARTEPSVPVLFAVPPPEAPPIRSPAAVIAGGNQAAAARFLAYLRSADAAPVFKAAGFGLATP